eukprot:5742044-Amphidinium_carterae.1
MQNPPKHAPEGVEHREPQTMHLEELAENLKSKDDQKILQISRAKPKILKRPVKSVSYLPKIAEALLRGRKHRNFESNRTQRNFSQTGHPTIHY